MDTYLRGISKFTFTDECDMSAYICGYDGLDWCSGQGWCDFCTGTCHCSSYAQGYKCQGKNFLYLTNDRKIANSYLQTWNVLAMVLVQIKVSAIIKLELALVMKDFKETSVKVIYLLS